MTPEEEQQASEARVNGMRETIARELEVNTNLATRWHDAIQQMIMTYSADPDMCAKEVLDMLFNLEQR